MSNVFKSPWEFPRIEAKGKRRFEVGYPLLGAIGAGAFLFTFQDIANVVGPAGLVDQGNALLRVLIGVFAAALGVVLGLKWDVLGDMAMSGGEPIVLRRRDGSPSHLNMRQLLAALYGYLVLTAVALHVAGVAAMTIESGIPAATRWIVGAVYCLIYANILSVMFLGVRYTSTLLPSSEAARQRRRARPASSEEGGAVLSIRSGSRE